MKIVQSKSGLHHYVIEAENIDYIYFCQEHIRRMNL